MLFDLFLYPGARAVCAKSRVPNNQNASCTWGCSIFSQWRPYWNPQYNEQQAYRHCTLRLTLTVTVNPKITIICGFSCPLTLQLLLQILPQVATFILLDQNLMLTVERNVVHRLTRCRQRYIHRYICKSRLMNKICYDPSKFSECWNWPIIGFSGSDNESRIVVTRIRGSESDRSCEVWPQSGLWSQYGRYFKVKPNPSPVELGGSVGWVLDWGSKGTHCLESHCVVSFQKQDILSLSAAALVLV